MKKLSVPVDCCDNAMSMPPAPASTSAFNVKPPPLVPPLVLVPAINVIFPPAPTPMAEPTAAALDRKSTRLNSSHQIISYAVFCLKKKKLSLVPDHTTL